MALRCLDMHLIKMSMHSQKRGKRQKTPLQLQPESSSLPVQHGQGELQSLRQYGKAGTAGHKDETPALTRQKCGTCSNSADTLHKHCQAGLTDADDASSESAAWQYIVAADGPDLPAEQEDAPLLGKFQRQEQASAPVKFGPQKDDFLGCKNEQAADPDGPIASCCILQTGSEQTSDRTQQQVTALEQGIEEDHLLPPAPSRPVEDAEQVTDSPEEAGMSAV